MLKVVLIGLLSIRAVCASETVCLDDESFLDEVQFLLDSKEEEDNSGDKDVDRNCIQTNLDSAKTILKEIKEQKKKGNEGDQKLQDLVDKFNKNMDELRRSYRNIKSRPRPSEEDVFRPIVTHNSVDQLNWTKKRKLLRDKNSEEVENGLDPLEVPESESISSGTPNLENASSIIDKGDE
jgi:hypothetical protein